MLSSHLLSDVEDVCDRMTILYGGKIHAEGTSDQLLVDSERTIIQVPRIKNDNTIEQIESILEKEEGNTIESVKQPRQTLEAFFIQIVDKARAQHIETSGAEGGTTAPFLLGDEEGEVLIDKLLDSKEMATRSVEQTIQPATQDNDSAVLDSLINTEEEPNRVVEATESIEAPKQADASVIDSLLSGNSKDDHQDKQ